MKRKYEARAIVEVAGKPKKHVEDTIKLLLEKLKDESGIKVKHAKTHQAEEHDGVFSTFAELELEFMDGEAINLFCFEYLPSSIEFLEPQELQLGINELTETYNQILGRMHSADQVIKALKADNQVLERNSTAMLRNALNLALKDGQKTMEEISNAVGIMPDQLKPFLAALEKGRIVKKKYDKYSL